MISCEDQKDVAFIQKIQTHESEPVVYRNFFSSDDIARLHEARKTAFEDHANCAQKLFDPEGRPRGRMAHPAGDLKNDIEALLRPKLEKHLHHPFALAFTFHENYFPYGIHTDSGYDPTEHIYKQGIIPLAVDPPGANVYTVIFDQKCYHSASYSWEAPTLSEEQKALVHNLTAHSRVSQEELNYYFGPQAARATHGFSINQAFLWRVGDMAYWDRSHFHCSSYFKGHGVHGKTGLMWISWRI